MTRSMKPSKMKPSMKRSLRRAGLLYEHRRRKRQNYYAAVRDARDHLQNELLDVDEWSWNITDLNLDRYLSFMARFAEDIALASTRAARQISRRERKRRKK